MPATNLDELISTQAETEIQLKIQQLLSIRTQRCCNCDCYYSHHAMGSVKEECNNCSCPRFIQPSSPERRQFRALLKWSRKWLKPKKGKGRKIARFKEIWNILKKSSVGCRYLRYCENCRASIIVRNTDTKPLLRRDEGLACICGYCAKCCNCRECPTCHVLRLDERFCRACKQCTNICCSCRTCDLCNHPDHNDYCRNCGNCNACCQCGWERRVPLLLQKPIFHSANLKQHQFNPTNRFIATEIEVASINGNGLSVYQLIKKWGASTVYDSSLPKSGFEINTAPATGDIFVNQVNEICESLKKVGARINDKCGLHVHVDARDFTYYDIRRLVKIYAAIEYALFGMVPQAREYSRYCKPCGQRYVKALEEGRIPYKKVKADVTAALFASESLKEAKRNKHHTARYTALNIHSWFYRGTIECRMFNGTINAETINNWCILWAMIMDYTLKNSDEAIAIEMVGEPLVCLEKIIAGNQKLIEFIKARTAMFPRMVGFTPPIEEESPQGQYNMPIIHMPPSPDPPTLGNINNNVSFVEPIYYVGPAPLQQPQEVVGNDINEWEQADPSPAPQWRRHANLNQIDVEQDASDWRVWRDYILRSEQEIAMMPLPGLIEDLSSVAH